MKRNCEAKVLCVDDEPNVLQGLSLHLRKRYAVETATSGKAGLEILEQDPSIAVVVSDMRMPGMDGATFLARAKLVCPDATRILLTGQADLDAAIASINEGQIFRFLTKPCPPWIFISTIAGAVAQHNLVRSERVLLEKTLVGCIKTLTDVLSLSDPVAFGRATRIKKLVAELMNKIELQERWQMEVAAIFSQLGHLTLPRETANKVYFGTPLSDDEQALIAGLPTVIEQLLGNIPRLETVSAILSSALGAGPVRRPKENELDPEAQLVADGSAILRAALDFDELESQGNDAPIALGTMRQRTERYTARVLDALEELRAADDDRLEIENVALAELRIGMVLAQDIKLADGTLLAARGYEITPRFLQRIRYFSNEVLRSIVKAIVRVRPVSAA